jgi:cell division septum initiation protein DivIVA
VSFITPADFRDFAPEQRRGKYEAAEVDDLLAFLTAQYTQVWDERAALEERLATVEREATEAREELARYRAREQHLAQALLHAEAIAAELRQAAERDAKALLEDARTSADATLDEARTTADALLDEVQARADELLSEARTERDQLEHEITQLAERRKELRADYRELLVTALKLVDDDPAAEPGDDDHAESPQPADRAPV